MCVCVYIYIYVCMYVYMYTFVLMFFERLYACALFIEKADGKRVKVTMEV